MQPRVTEIRETLTAAQVEALIKTDPAIVVGRGMELLDRHLNVLDDLTPYLRDCTTSRDNLATLHGHASFTLATRLAWGKAVVRPYITISNGLITARFNQGAYTTNTPQHVTDSMPTTYSVEGYDILNALNRLVADSYSVTPGQTYLDAIEAILTNQGYSQYVIDPVRINTVVTAPLSWPIDDQTTWLMIVNKLLHSIGYKKIYSDWHGRLVCEAMTDVVARAPEWVYDRGLYTGQMAPGQVITHDYFDTPNRWVGIQGNVTDTGVTLTEGDGIFTYDNLTNGETSQEARDQVIPRVINVSAVDQAALVSAVMAQVAADSVVSTTMEAQTSVNPLHWHQDVISVDTLEFGTVKMQVGRWSMDLKTGRMSHSWALA